MRALLDCDGVLANFCEGICKALTTHGFLRTPADVKHWDLSSSFSTDEMRVIANAMTEPGFCRDLEWYSGAREFVRTLSRAGEVHAVTAPFCNGPSWMYERLGWLSTEIPSNRIYFVSGEYKHLVRGDVLIEDHPKNAHDWLEGNPNGIAILIDRPWNSPAAKEFWPHSRMLRVHSFDEAVQAIKECA